MKKLLVVALALMLGAAGYAANYENDTLVVVRTSQGIGSFDIKHIPASGETRSIKFTLLDAYTRKPLQEKVEDLDESDLEMQPNGRGLVRLLRNPGRVNMGVHEIDEDGTFTVTDLEPGKGYTFCLTVASSHYGYIAVPFYSSVENSNIECEVLFKSSWDNYDVNCDHRVNVSDVSTLVNMILGVTPTALVLGDVDKSMRINVSDISSLINHILGNEQ